MTDEDPTVEPVPKEPKRKPNAIYLLDMIKARKAYAFRDEAGNPYIADGPATISRGAWGGWLSSIWWDVKKTPLNEDARKTVIETMEAHAANDDIVEPVYIRVGPVGDGIAIDMGNSAWEAIVATTTGWTIEPAPIRFRRTPSFGELPEPSRQGTLAPLGGLLNLHTVENQRLVIGFLLGSLNPDGPYPVLGLSGMQGSGKSVTARFVRGILDPVAKTAGNGLKSLTKDESSFWTTAYNSWLPAFDNISGISPEVADRLCQLVIGGGRSARRLYSDGDLYEQSACRPVILNGLELTDRPDLLSRTIPVELPRITERATEQYLLRQFHKVHARILGGLMDVIAGPEGLLARLPLIPDIKTDGSRLYDHVRWLTAAEKALGWADGAYETLFEGSQDSLLANSTDGIVWLDAMNALLDGHGGTWEGSAGDLLKDLRKEARDDLMDGEKFNDFGWPKTARGMASGLIRYGESLRSVLILHSTEYDPHNKTMKHHLASIPARNGAIGGSGIAGVAGVAPYVAPLDPTEEEKKGEGGDTNPREARTPALPPPPIRRSKKKVNGYAPSTPPPDPDAAKTWQEVYAEIMANVQKERPDA